MTAQILVTIALAALAVSSCRGGRPGVKMYEGVGVIVSVDRDAGTVEIKHEDIKGYMTAMTMPFKASRPSLLANVAPGDRVDFTLRDDGNEVLLVRIEKNKSPDS